MIYNIRSTTTNIVNRPRIPRPCLRRSPATSRLAFHLIRLAAKYALTQDAGLRFEDAFQRWTSDDRTWSTWAYTDGASLFRGPVQKVRFFGASGHYRWW